MAQATHAAAMEALQQEVEDANDVRVALENRFAADISSRDDRVLHLENILASQDGDASRFATDAQLARDEASKGGELCGSGVLLKAHIGHYDTQNRSIPYAKAVTHASLMSIAPRIPNL